MTKLINDFRRAARLHMKSPGFTLAAIGEASLSVGIGTSTIVFSAVNTVLLRAVPLYGAATEL